MIKVKLHIVALVVKTSRTVYLEQICQKHFLGPANQIMLLCSDVTLIEFLWRELKFHETEDDLR
jgi:hypothetical protein